MNLENRNVLETNDIITGTGTIFSKKECNDIGNKWMRECPKCKIIITYKSKKAYLNCKKLNTNCRKCAVKESWKYKDKLFFQSDGYKKRMSKTLKEIRTGNGYGEKFKQKCRENKLSQIKKCGVQRTFNRNACNFIDTINSKFGYQFQHGLNGGEVQIIGYSLDGYDKNKNAIFEYDEPKHHNHKVRIKDIERQNRLISYLRPSAFLRYDEKFETLYDVVSGRRLL